MLSKCLVPIIALKGKSEKVIKAIFTRKSATAKETQKGALPRNPKIGVCSRAHEISLDGSKKERLAEKAIKKKIVVSTEDPKNEEIKGAFHHLVFRSKLKIETSNN